MTHEQRPDQLDIQIEMTLRAIRKHVANLRDDAAQWEPTPTPENYR